MGEVQKLKGKEKFAYGIGAVGKDMVYMLSASYVLYYYQDIMGVSAAPLLKGDQNGLLPRHQEPDLPLLPQEFLFSWNR